jgi:hypothetical protein
MKLANPPPLGLGVGQFECYETIFSLMGGASPGESVYIYGYGTHLGQRRSGSLELAGSLPSGISERHWDDEYVMVDRQIARSREAIRRSYELLAECNALAIPQKRRTGL